MNGPTSRLVDVNGLRYRYLEWGDAAAPAVVLLHGLRSYAHTWDPVAEALSGSYRLVAPDLRGRGDSDWDPRHDYYTDRYVEDVESLVARLGLTRFALVGHSMGGSVTYAYAARHPGQVTAAVVEDIGPGSSTDTAGADRILREMASTPTGFGSLEEVYAYWRRLRPDVTDEALASRVQNTVRPGSAGRWEWKLDMAGIAAARRRGDPARSIDLWACVDALRCPTLVVRGARSDFLPVETCRAMAERQPLVRWREVAGAGHYVHDDAPDTFIRLVTAFLDEAPR
jgi:pimeloyl-ACP methyl ester carboxylesterase